MTVSDFFEHLNHQRVQNLPFVAYRKPGELPVNALLQPNDDLNTVLDFTEKGFVFAPYDIDKPAVIIQGAKIVTSQFESTTLEDEKEFTGFNSTEEEKQKHVDLVQKSIKTIEKSALQKVVLSREQIITLPATDVFDVFKSLLQKYAQAFVYIFFHPKVGLWLGASPETLLSLKRNRLKTMALAGTQIYKGTLDVEWGEKEKEEQQIVVDEISHKLKEIGVGNLKKSPRITQKAGNILHLSTQINAVLDEKSPAIKEIIAALHPTPAVCGLPRHLAQDFIANNETYARSFYTGFLGELNMETVSTRSTNRRNTENLAYRAITTATELFVNLRCMQIKDITVHIYVGGGITKSSVPEDEWEETCAKARTMSRVLPN